MSTRCSCGAGHETFGACMRAKNVRVGYCRSSIGHDLSTQKRWDAELDLYAAAKRQGVQPDGTSTAQIRAALDASEAAGRAYNAEQPGGGVHALAGE